MIPRRSLLAALLLSASSSFAADLSVSLVAGDTLIRAGLAHDVAIAVHNPGPDVAKDVKITATSSVPVTPAFYDLGDVFPNSNPTVAFVVTAPSTAGSITITATVTSSTPDPNSANNTTSVTLTVSTEPDVVVGLSAPVRQDLALPFTLGVFIGNSATTDAHDVEVSIGFRNDVVVRTLPEGCVSPGTGRVVCREDVVAGLRPAVTPRFSIGLVAPEQYGDGSIVFIAVATEREHDFNPISNTQRAETALYRTFYVTSTQDFGFDTLRQAILESNQACASTLCAIAFRIEEQSPNAWKTIRINSPLPAVTTGIRIDGATQSALTGSANPDGPSVEISGAGSAAGDGLTISGCGAEVASLAINGFPGNGISVNNGPGTNCQVTKATLHHLFVGTDPTGSAPRPNLRGIGTSFGNGAIFNTNGAAATIHDCVISGNTRSGIFGLSGRLNVFQSRIGVKAHGDEPLPNGNAGIYVGSGGYGSELTGGNVIAFNGQMGIALASDVGDVGIRSNRIWGNGGLGIDVGLDGPGGSAIPVPVITLAHYDPVTKKTVVEGDLGAAQVFATSFSVDLYANDAPDPLGFGEGQRPLAIVLASSVLPAHFKFSVDGDLTGQFVTATATRLNFIGFAKLGSEGIDQGFLTQTSEFSRAVEVR